MSDELMLEEYIKPLVELTRVRTSAVERLARAMKNWHFTVDEIRTDDFLSRQLDSWVKMVKDGTETRAMREGEILIVFRAITQERKNTHGHSLPHD